MNTEKLMQIKGVRVYIVGGYVRDRLLNRPCEDHDFVVCGATPEQMIDCGFSQVGADFPVFLNENGDEFALARTERKTGDGYHGFECDFNTDLTIEDDLVRRDLTINSMAREVIGWNELGHAKLDDIVIDPCNGREDLRNGLIRHTGPAFKEDPVRILRTARFASRYGFDLSLMTDSLMKTMVIAGDLNHVTPERVWVEFEKAMKQHSRTWDFLNILEETGALAIVAPHLVGQIDDDLRERLHEADVNKNSVAIKCAIITSRLTLSFAAEVWMFMKAPKDVIHLATMSSQCRATFETNWEDTAEQKLQLLKILDAFRNENTLMDIICVMDGPNADKALMLWSAFKKVKGISWADLSINEQVGLEGKSIGEAIDKLRLSKI